MLFLFFKKLVSRLVDFFAVFVRGTFGQRSLRLYLPFKTKCLCKKIQMACRRIYKPPLGLSFISVSCKMALILENSHCKLALTLQLRIIFPFFRNYFNSRLHARMPEQKGDGLFTHMLFFSVMFSVSHRLLPQLSLLIVH